MEEGEELISRWENGEKVLFHLKSGQRGQAAADPGGKKVKNGQNFCSWLIKMGILGVRGREK